MSSVKYACVSSDVYNAHEENLFAIYNLVPYLFACLLPSAHLGHKSALGFSWT